MLAKAKITNLVTNEAVTCMFNPQEYTFTKNNTWTRRAVKGANVANVEFGGGEPGTLDLQLLFDTYEAHTAGQLSVAAGDDVRRYTKGLWDIMKVSDQNRNATTGKGEPPKCRFEWGSLWSFEAVITKISQRFTLFAADGTPLRAILDVSFMQIKDEGQYPRQNPTSGGSPGEHLRTVREGETLAGIAYEEYRDPTVWRHIAATNGIDDPRRLRSGQVLIITPLPSR